jgi:hypothetical protein
MDGMDGEKDYILIIIYFQEKAILPSTLVNVITRIG